jgi:PAS domain S-box-containing protein
LPKLSDLLQNWIAILTGLLALAGTLFASWKRVKRRFLQGWLERRKSLRSLSECKEALLDLAGRRDEIANMLLQNADERAALTRIEGMLKPNGGSSLFDAINRIEKQMAINQTAQRLVLIEDTAIMFWTDASGRYGRVSKAYAELVGRSAEEMLGEGWKSHLASNCRKSVAEEWSYAVKERREFYMRLDMENRSTHRIITADVSALPAKVQGEVVGYVGRVIIVETSR